MKKLRVGVLAVFALLAACTASLPPAETTDDGLVRVPSRPEGGVYRNLDADFTRYKRLMIEPLTVEFLKGWRKQHRDVSDAEVRRIQAETTNNFREVFTENLVDEGPFELAEVREADVLVVVPRMLDLKIPAPETEQDAGYRSSSPRQRLHADDRRAARRRHRRHPAASDHDRQPRIASKCIKSPGPIASPMRTRSAAAWKGGHAWSARQSTWPRLRSRADPRAGD